MYKVKYKNITHDHLSANPCLDPSFLSQEVKSNQHSVATRLFVVFWTKQKSTHGATLDFYTANLQYKNASSDLRSGGRVMGGIFRVLSGDGVLILLGNRFPTNLSCVQEGEYLPSGFDPNVLFSCITLSGSPWADESSCSQAHCVKTSTTYSSMTCLRESVMKLRVKVRSSNQQDLTEGTFKPMNSKTCLNQLHTDLERVSPSESPE